MTLDKLKSFIDANFSHFITVNINTNPRSKEKIETTDDGKTVKLNLSAFTPEEKEELKKLLLAEHEDGKKLFEEKSSEHLEDIAQTFSLSSTHEILDFYKDKISDYHLEALEASLVLRNAFRRGENVDDLKEDIKIRFGDVGNNIANLCTAGYFEGYIKNVYEEMSKQPDFRVHAFRDYFNKIVSLHHFAIFVSRDMRSDELEGTVRTKLNAYKKYGIRFLDIHGIGKQNVEKIKQLHAMLEAEDMQISINQVGNIIHLRVNLSGL